MSQNIIILLIIYCISLRKDVEFDSSSNSTLNVKSKDFDQQRFSNQSKKSKSDKKISSSSNKTVWDTSKDAAVQNAQEVDSVPPGSTQDNNNKQFYQNANMLKSSNLFQPANIVYNNQQVNLNQAEPINTSNSQNSQISENPNPMSEQSNQPYQNANNLKISNAISGRYPTQQTQTIQPNYQSQADGQIKKAQNSQINGSPQLNSFSKQNQVSSSLMLDNDQMMMQHGVYCPKICVANFNVDKSSCPRDCLPSPSPSPLSPPLTPYYPLPSTLSPSMLSQTTPTPTGMGMIAVNHGLPGGTLMQVPFNPFNSLVGVNGSASAQVMSAVNPNFNNGKVNIVAGYGVTGMQGIPPFSSNFVDPNLMSSQNQNMMSEINKMSQQIGLGGNQFPGPKMGRKIIKNQTDDVNKQKNVGDTANYKGQKDAVDFKDEKEKELSIVQSNVFDHNIDEKKSIQVKEDKSNNSNTENKSIKISQTEVKKDEKEGDTKQNTVKEFKFKEMNNEKESNNDNLINDQIKVLDNK